MVHQVSAKDLAIFPPKGGGTRGIIIDFSGQSRMRMMETTSRLDLEKQCGASLKPKFLTLTFGDAWPGTAADCEKVFERFKKRLYRRWRAGSMIWRKEFQERGAPHYHGMLFGFPFIPKEWIQEAWTECAAEYCTEEELEKGLFTRIELMINPRKCLNYVSKYLSKLPEGSPSTDVTGEPTEAHGDTGDGVAEGQDTGFNSVTYLDAEEPQSIGRQWGIFNRKHLPWATVRVFLLTLGQAERVRGFMNHLSPYLRGDLRGQGKAPPFGLSATWFAPHENCVDWDWFLSTPSLNSLSGIFDRSYAQ